MRIGTKSDNEFLGLLNQKNQAIQEKFLQNIENLTKPLSVKVMLGDSTVKDEKTFDPKTIEEFYRKFITELDEWESQKISTSYNDDVRRIFVKFQIKIGCYLLSLHMSLQFHVLLYYKTDNLVLDTQKELAKIIDQDTLSSASIVTHNGLLRCLIGSSFGIKKKDWYKLLIPHGTSLEFFYFKNQFYPNIPRKFWSEILQNIGYVSV